MTSAALTRAGQPAKPGSTRLKIAEEEIAERMFKLEHEERRLNLETWIRGVVLMLVVLALVLYPLYALIFDIPGTSLADVIAPVTGITGAVVGYWFGQASRRIQTPPPAAPSTPAGPLPPPSVDRPRPDGEVV